jgi:hypothetical protein
MLMDIMLALFIAVALLMSLAAAVAKLHRSERQMADSRAASRRLEQALISLQSGPVTRASRPPVEADSAAAPAAQQTSIEASAPRPPAPAALDPDLHIERLPGALNGRVWVRLSIPVGSPALAQPRASLVGLIPAANAPGGAP